MTSPPGRLGPERANEAGRVGVPFDLLPLGGDEQSGDGRVHGDSLVLPVDLVSPPSTLMTVVV